VTVLSSTFNQALRVVGCGVGPWLPQRQAVCMLALWRHQPGDVSRRHDVQNEYRMVPSPPLTPLLIIWNHCSIWRMASSGMLGHVALVLTRATRYNIPEDIFHSHRHENLKSYIFKFLCQCSRRFCTEFLGARGLSFQNTF
jgi:hypothetical protein